MLGLIVQLWAENAWGTDPQGNSVFEKLPHFSTLKALLINSAEQYAFSGATHDLTRTHQGWGRANVRNAMERAATSFVVDEEETLTLGEIVTYDVVVSPGETELKITMTYPDPPGTTSATLHRINDVDLKVTSPLGAVYYGNVGLDVGRYSLPGGAPNGVDTVENVFVDNPDPGTWSVEIEAAEINQDAHLATPQDDVAFALVVTGAIGAAECGNGLLETGEQCDGGDLGGTTCEDRACAGGGTLGCTAQCTFDLSQCVGCPTCGDGACQIGEDCLTCSADCIFESAAVCGNGFCEAADGENCVGCPEDCNGEQKGNPSGRYCCGDGAVGDNPVPCTDSRCNAGGSLCTEFPSLAYCCGDALCEGDETLQSCALDCTPPSPGEAASDGSLRVTGFDEVGGVLSLSYGIPCQATDHIIEFGALTHANMASYDWSGQQCSIGASGTYDWSLAGTPDSLFFVVVATDATHTGSYGTDSAGQERPEDPANLLCPAPQSLTFRCD